MVLDEEIKKDIIDNLYWDARVDASKVRVEVEDGVVILSGTVPTYTAKQAARDDSMFVTGVYSVVNNITVEIPGVVEVPSDIEIRERVEDALLYNPDIESLDILVEVVDGEVTLEGNVDAFWKKIEAEESAYNITGVWNVINKLTIVPTDSIDDKVIADEIMDSLIRKNTVDETLVDVVVKNGKVTLTGEVDDWIAYSSAEDSAIYTPGVIEVNNNLTIV